MNNEQFERLPKYARIEIHRLRNDLEHYAEQRRAMDVGMTNTRIKSYTEPDIYLPDRAAVVFEGETGAIQVQVSRFGEIEATTTGMGNKLSVIPSASNLVELKVVE